MLVTLDSGLKVHAYRSDKETDGVRGKMVSFGFNQYKAGPCAQHDVCTILDISHARQFVQTLVDAIAWLDEQE